MRCITRLSAVAAVVVLVGCRDNSPVQSSLPSITTMISDGAHLDANGKGNRDFFFLPPLVANPVGSPNYDAGRFNEQLSPFVEVCELTAVDAASLLNAACKSTTERVFGPARMELDGSSEQYQLNWDTKTSPLNPLSFYRIIVRGSPQGAILGFLDVDPVLGGMKNAKTGEVFVFQDGRTMPIKVRIEDGAFGSSNASDRVEQVVPNVLPATGLDVTTNTGFAGAHFENDWLPRINGTPIQQVVVIIERVPITSSEARCLNTPFEQLEGCYVFRTDPDLHTLVPETELLFNRNVVAGVCFQYPADVGGHDRPFELYRSEVVDAVLTEAVPLIDEVPAPFLHCANFGPSQQSIGAALRSGRLGDIAKAGWSAISRAIGRVVQPTALHAVDLGAGGSTNEFSRFGFVRPASMSVTAGQGAVAPAGSTLQASVQLENHHSHGASETEVDEVSPVVGQPVTFTVTSGGGTVSTATCSEGTSCPATTNSDGVASVTWRLATGANTIQVTTNQVRNSPQTITATGVPTTVVRVGVNDFTIDLSAGRMLNPSGLDGSVFFNGTQVLFGAGFAYATSETDILVGYNTANQNSDFEPTAVAVVSVGGSETPHHTTAEVRPGGDRAGIPGVTVTQESFALSNTEDAGYVLLKYTLTNTNAGEVRNVFAGFVVDPDLLFSRSQVDDVAAFNHGLSVAEVAENAQQMHPQVIGIVPISMETGLNYFAWVNGADPTTSAGWFDFLSTSASGVTVSAGPADVRFLTGVGPFSIPAEESWVVWFALVGGVDRDTFNANVTAARAKVQSRGM